MICMFACKRLARVRADPVYMYIQSCICMHMHVQVCMYIYTHHHHVLGRKLDFYDCTLLFYYALNLGQNLLFDKNAQKHYMSFCNQLTQ